jgi:hypothetical protein
MYVDFQLCALQILALVSNVWYEKYLYNFCANYLCYIRKRDITALFVGRLVYSKAGKSNFLPSTKIKIQSSITQLVVTV